MVQGPKDRDQGGHRQPPEQPRERPTMPERPDRDHERKSPDAGTPPHGTGDGEND